MTPTTDTKPAPRRKAPEPLPQPNTVEIQQLRLSPDAELITSATVEFSVGGHKRYVKTELKEFALDGEEFDDYSFRAVDAVRTHILRMIEDIAASEQEFIRKTRSTR